MSQKKLSSRDCMLAKLRGEEVRSVPFSTYDFHPFGPHAKEPSHAELLILAELKAGVLMKHSLRAWWLRYTMAPGVLEAACLARRLRVDWIGETNSPCLVCSGAHPDERKA